MRENETSTTIESRIAIETAGDSLWRDSGSEIISIHSITTREYDLGDDHYFDVYVRHDSDWTIVFQTPKVYQWYMRYLLYESLNQIFQN